MPPIHLLQQKAAQSGFGILQLIILIVIILIIITIINALKNKKDVNSSLITQQDQINKVCKVSLIGGLIGLFSGSPVDSLNKRIKIENAQGWEVIQIIPDTNLNLLELILRILLLIITLFIYTTSNGYYIILKSKL